MLNFSQLRCFIKVAELLNYNRAAEELSITATAVSKQIKNLEHQLGEQLFVRDTRKVQLTAFGFMLLEKCQQLFHETQRIEQFIESRQTHPQGQITILVSNILARELILNRLADFVDQYPLIDCEFLFSEHDNDLARKDIDVMVGFPEIPPFTDQLKYRKMPAVTNILCGAPGLIKHYGMPTQASDLMSFPFISHSLRKPATELPLENGTYLPCPKPILFMDDFNALNQACKNGIGLFLTGDSLVKQALKDKTLIQVLPEIQFKRYEIFTFYQPYGSKLPKIRAFLDFYAPNPLVK
ncbi:transcriptional regulator [Legionella steigerwaltii]|uniref:Transcriptional regulator n=1 Tax=Legionella steigerwaltii TaxID=460 RepID=A0A378LAR0_9GAMM|nr:LysR family transcriptional regulator [Legionella steigerwaltii]KTD78517.1 transcriptional regulator [Legionella steigerwaltii]STY24125.1 transcriptional regulator [Legionella steigerwaltii]